MLVSASESSSVDTDTVRHQELGSETIREAVRATGFIKQLRAAPCASKG